MNALYECWRRCPSSNLSFLKSYLEVRAVSKIIAISEDTTKNGASTNVGKFRLQMRITCIGCSFLEKNLHPFVDPTVPLTRRMEPAGRSDDRGNEERNDLDEHS